MDVFFTCLLFLQKRITLTRAFCNSKQHSPLAARSTPLPVPQNQSESGGRHWACGKGQPWRGRMIEGLKGLSSVVGIQARPIDYAKMIKRACDLPTAPPHPLPSPPAPYSALCRLNAQSHGLPTALQYNSFRCPWMLCDASCMLLIAITLPAPYYSLTPLNLGECPDCPLPTREQNYTINLVECLHVIVE